MTNVLDLRGVPAALLRYRILAYIVGTALCVLVFVGIPLQIAGHDAVVAVAGATHGFLFIVYLVLIVDLTRRTRLPLVHMLLIMLAGLVPGATFYAEYRTRHWVMDHFPDDFAGAERPASPTGRVTTIR